MQRKRRSGRIAKELGIVLFGTDTAGKVFSEQTKTVVLSRHGAGIVSRYRFSPDEVLTLRLADSADEAEIRLVGQMGGEQGRYIYGVAFVDSDLHFWPMDFPPPDAFEPTTLQLGLECSRCQTRQNVEPHEIEDDVYSVNGYILRHCVECGTSTPWKKAEGKVPPATTPSPPKISQAPSEFRPSVNATSSSLAGQGKANLLAPPPSHPAGTPMPVLGASAAAFVESFELGLDDPHASAAADSSSSYSGASTISEFASLSDLQVSDIQTSPAVSSATAVLLAPGPAPIAASPGMRALPALAKEQAVPARELDANKRPVNKRRHVRIRVSFSACVRHPAHADEVVECENVSKGGVCFHSLQQYPLDCSIEIAAPFSPGETALFTEAKIRRVEELAGGLVFRYGVEYVKPSSAKPPF
jgi:hypothetical protein